jgi:hypothetical protein
LIEAANFSHFFAAHVFFCFFSLRQRKERKKSKQRKEKVKEYTLDIKKKSRRRQNSGRIALVLNRLTRPAPSYR